MKVWLKLSVQTFKGVWKFDCKLSTKLSGEYESLTANVQSFKGYASLQNFNQSFKGYASLTANVQPNFQCNPKNIKDVQICWLFLFETKAIHQDLYKFFLITMLKCFFGWDQTNPPGFAYVVLMRVILQQQSNPTARNQFCFKFENKSWSKKSYRPK